MRSMFTEPETWRGGSIELLIALGPSSPERKLQALQAVWQWPALIGPYAQHTVEPEQQARASIAVGASLYGVAMLPDGAGRVAFATHVIEDDDGAWLYAGVPLGSLGTAYEVGAFPFGDRPAPWRRAVYAWLYGLAQHVFAHLEFERGTIGWLTAVDVDELLQQQLPSRRFHGYVVAQGGVLQYFPPSQGEF